MEQLEKDNKLEMMEKSNLRASSYYELSEINNEIKKAMT